MEELKLDIAEVETLLKQATRPKVKDTLSIYLRKIQTELVALRDTEETQGASAEELPKPIATSQTVKKPSRYTKQISTYAWDQSAKFMKIYVTLDGVQNSAAENIKSEFKDKSFKLRAEDVSGVDYEVHVAFLFDRIIPEKSYHKVKSDMVVLFLKKKEEKTWAYVTEQEGKASKKKEPKKPAASDDPQAGLMDMMKQMYEDGDDDMKRTIAKAWTESQDKKNKGPSDLDMGRDMPSL